MIQADPIPFNRPWMSGKEIDYIVDAHARMHLSGDGEYTRRCHEWIQQRTGTVRALLTHSCTAALELAALLVDIRPGDEVIMPSWTFVSTANSVVLRGGVPVFVDVRRDTLNLDERLIKAAITPRTKGIIPVHYAGVACEMDAIMAIAALHDLWVVEDAAQGVMARYKGRDLGALGHLGAFSFHETKNIISGEGGALLVNRPDWVHRAETLREKGTDRGRFFRGEVDKYSWQDLGSSFLPGELVAAFLYAQLEAAQKITCERLESWTYYHQLLGSLEARGLIERPTIPPDCEHNAHLYRVLLAKDLPRDFVLKTLKSVGINAMFHYVPLHDSPAGRRFGRVSGELKVTEMAAEQLIRLPLWNGLSPSQQERVVFQLASF